ncbi:MAG TPA: hypothetical protein VFE98_03940 [Candidatus Bathyarchaeia archaeon]|nr:hypothetical protein [Candidatus Bathyarchaeia archaeon]
MSRFISFLKRHPLLFLIILTPGIPEYLSSSSSLSMILFNPLLFFLFLAANIALYGSGVILIREAMIRWRKGWATVILLGMAYAIVEEGLALRTLFNPNSSVVGNLGVYGHWMGVNWVWTVGLLIFHSVYSIALPIFLFGLVFPELKRQSLARSRGIGLSVVALIIDSVFLQAIVNYDPGVGLLALFSAIAAALVVAGMQVPANLLKTSPGPARWAPKRYAMLGTALFPATLLAGGFSAGANIPPVIPCLIDFFFMYIILSRTYRSLGSEKNQEHKVGFAIGLLLPVVVFGMVASIAVINPLILVADFMFVLFSRRLWRKWHHMVILERFSLQPGMPSFGGPASSP